MISLKYRNAQKRAWRNKRNWERHLKRANEAQLAAARSHQLWQEAEDDMWFILLQMDTPEGHHAVTR
jgi:hypothetical protein